MALARRVLDEENLAGAYASAGLLDRAITLYEQNMNARRRVLGPENPATLNSGHNLAGAYFSAGRVDDAVAPRPCVRKVVLTFSSFRPPNSNVSSSPSLASTTPPTPTSR